MSEGLPPLSALLDASARARRASRGAVGVALVLGCAAAHAYTFFDGRWDGGWLLREGLTVAALVVAAALVRRPLVPVVLVTQPLAWLLLLGAEMAYDDRSDPVPKADGMEPGPCTFDPDTRLVECGAEPFDPSSFGPQALREARWYAAHLWAHLLGPALGSYTGPLLTEAEAVATAKNAIEVPFTVAGVAAQFTDPGAAGAWASVDLWRDATTLAAVPVGADGVLLSWDDGRYPDLYDRRLPVLVQAWTPGRPGADATVHLGDTVFTGPLRTPDEVAIRRHIFAWDGPRNALWLRRRWLHEPRTDEEISALVGHLLAHDIDTIYPFVGPLRPGGRFGWRDGDTLHEYDPEMARAFFARVHAAAAADPRGLGLKILPWTGGVLDRDVHLADPEWRAAFVAQAKALVALGADGVQLNIEPMPEDRAEYLTLLDELRAALGSAAIGVAAYPPPTPLHPYPDVHWSPDFVAAVCARSDDVAVMAYDTALPTAAAYTRLVTEWIDELGSTLPATGACRWRLGVPDYDDDAPWHRPEAETLRAALDGVLAARNPPGGLAVYASWTTDPKEWATFDLLWRREGPLDVERIDPDPDYRVGPPPRVCVQPCRVHESEPPGRRRRN